VKAHLLYRCHNFDRDLGRPWNAEALIEDLGLDTVLDAMADGNPFFADVARTVLLTSEPDPDTILHRQAVLRDVLAHPEVAAQIYELAGDVVAGERRIYRGYVGEDPSATLNWAVRVLQLCTEALRTLRQLARDHRNVFESDGLTELWGQLLDELTDAYFDEVGDTLDTLKFEHGMRVSARLGQGNKGRDYVLRTPPRRTRDWLRWLTGDPEHGLSFQINERDDGAMQALAELRGRGVDLAADALARSGEHMLSFFTGLRWELAFYLGCGNLHRTLTEAGWPTSFPTPLSAGSRTLKAGELYDAGLCLRAKTGLVGNDLHAEDKDLLLITGANQGGKSTFLRALGVAQLMTQCGMFVTARSLSASVAGGVYTHYRREEDEWLIHGKFDEELSRFSDTVDDLPAHAMVLFNESFASTNEREGSEIARQVICGLRDSGVRVLFVTHLHDLAHGLYAERDPAALFLRAERAEDGTRTYRIVEGEPLATSYGPDLYAEVFGSSAKNRVTGPPDHAA
jgi:hypothetical protein